MVNQNPEQIARDKIDKILKAAGWAGIKDSFVYQGTVQLPTQEAHPQSFPELFNCRRCTITTRDSMKSSTELFNRSRRHAAATKTV